MATSLSRGPGRVWRHLSSQQPARSLHEDFTRTAETQPRRAAKVRVVVNYLPNPPPTTTLQVVHNTDSGKYYLQLMHLQCAHGGNFISDMANTTCCLEEMELRKENLDFHLSWMSNVHMKLFSTHMKLLYFI